MRFFVDPSRRLVRTHDSDSGYPFSSNNWIEVSGKDYDAFSHETYQEFTRAQLKRIRVEGQRLTQAWLDETGRRLMDRCSHLPVGPVFKSKAAAKLWAATNNVIIVSKPTCLS